MRLCKVLYSRSRLENLQLQLSLDKPTMYGSFIRPKPTNKQITEVYESSNKTFISPLLSTSNALTDSFGRSHTYLRISLTERCNLRCTYCMPEAGIAHLTPNSDLLTSEEILRLASVFVSLGVTKIRLTGGEPTLRSDLIEIVKGLSSFREEGLKTIAMTTNGIVLERHLSDLTASGLTHVNISLDSLRPHRFAKMSRRPEASWDRVWASIQSAVSSPSLKGAVKVNCVVMRGINEDEVADFAKLTLEYPIDVRFIELMPFDGNDYQASATVGWREMLSAITTIYPTIAPMQDGDGTSKMWKIPGSVGRIGFISTMTDAFCGTCSRLRLTADGNIRACLHGDQEFSLRNVLRSGGTNDEVISVISSAVMDKHFSLGGKKNAEGLAAAVASVPLETTLPSSNTNGDELRRKRAMILIGG
jgi:GTP 3',8-cyclase / cyclic pyranopterin monophosphate synthase